MHRLAALIGSSILLVSLSAYAEFGGPGERQKLPIGELIPLSSWEKQFEITEGKDQGRIVPLTLERVSAGTGRWKLSFGDYAGIVVQNDAGRGLIMERLHLIKSRSYIVYDPALPVLPGSAIETNARASFKMFDAETGKLKRSGWVTHQLKRVARSRFDTPAGTIDGYHVVIDHRMDMPFAELDITLGLGFRLDQGPIFGSGEYTLTKLGIFKERKTASAALSAANGRGGPLH
jgi:hypothetical protein